MGRGKRRRKRKTREKDEKEGGKLVQSNERIHFCFSFQCDKIIKQRRRKKKKGKRKERDRDTIMIYDQSEGEKGKGERGRFLVYSALGLLSLNIFAQRHVLTRI